MSRKEIYLKRLRKDEMSSREKMSKKEEKRKEIKGGMEILPRA